MLARPVIPAVPNKAEFHRSPQTSEVERTEPASNDFSGHILTDGFKTASAPISHRLATTAPTSMRAFCPTRTLRPKIASRSAASGPIKVRYHTTDFRMLAPDPIRTLFPITD